ncbi:hypothetical protein [Mastigocoleus testarum]|uniref:Uncharacterized protein n=1 Tax=Mastigocoleus testarum BC008 TaxID=371196 RepID=A0A0V8A0U2_9CYAN|nr:hypothetical protein [Mastigocoleus testarum]KST70410.1 hypothetical protein BC008_45290 [Mastigocoleus testarum BC008]
MNLLDEIYNNHGISYGIDHFNQFLSELEKYDFAQMLAYQVKYPLRYLLEFILSTPSLWIKMLDNDWIRVMSVLNPRPKPFSREIDDAGYVDIHFLCKYLRVNAIELFLQQTRFSNEDKKKLLQYSNKISLFLFMDELDLDDLDGDYLMHKDELDKVRLKLISNGIIKPLNYNCGELREYIQIELKTIENQ